MVGVTLESSSVTWDSAHGIFHLQSDSLWYLTRTTLEYRINGGSWIQDRAVFPDLDGRFGFASPAIDSNTTIDVRFRWEAQPPPGAPTFSFTTLAFPVVIRDSSHVEPRGLSIHWHLEPAEIPITAQIWKSWPGGGTWGNAIDIQSDVQGRIAFIDSDLEPATFYAYRLYVTIAGTLHLVDEIGLTTSEEDSCAIGCGDLAPLSMTAPFPNPALTAFTTTVAVPDGIAATADLFDIAGRRRWSRSLAAGVRTVRVETRGLPRGVYNLVVRQGSHSESRRIVILE
jgi:hypothetical protein